jgi:hypothetical protein
LNRLGPISFEVKTESTAGVVGAVFESYFVGG